MSEDHGINDLIITWSSSLDVWSVADIIYHASPFLSAILMKLMMLTVHIHSVKYKFVGNMHFIKSVEI